MGCPLRVALHLDDDVETSRTRDASGVTLQYIIDQSGKIVFQHDGEGQYEQMDRTIARLLSGSS